MSYLAASSAMPMGAKEVDKPRGAMIRIPRITLTLIVGVAVTFMQKSVAAQSAMYQFLQCEIGLTSSQIDAIHDGTPQAVSLPARSPSEVFLIGVIYIKAPPERYLNYARDIGELRKLSSYEAVGSFSAQPVLSDLRGFTLDRDEVDDLKHCIPGDCSLQISISSIEKLGRTINWSSPDVFDQVNEYVRRDALNVLLAYQQAGNPALGVYNDKPDPTVVDTTFASLLTYKHLLLQRYLPGLYQHLMVYPKEKSPGMEDRFYWAKVRFGLKPTFRIVHTVMMKGDPKDSVAYAIAEKQLYATHYFKSALNLSICIRDADATKAKGFYLMMIMGSEQSGLTGARGTVLRKVAVNRSIANLRRALINIRERLEKQ